MLLTRRRRKEPPPATAIAMSKPQHPRQPLQRTFFRVLMTASLTLSVAVLWGEARRQSVQDVMHGAPVTVGMLCGLTLFIASVCGLRRFGRLAVYGLLIGLWTVFVCLLPTV